MTTPAQPGPGPGQLRQVDIYLKGFQGSRPAVPVDAAERETRAHAAMSDLARAYIAGGAGAETTMAANRQALLRRRIVPRMGRDCTGRDLGVTLLGRRHAAPVLTAPIGVLSLVHPEADLAVARATARTGVTMITSNQASYPIEQIADCAHGGHTWFQLYWGRSDALVASLARRAEAAGCEAIVVTLDTTILGWRPRDLDLGHLPFLHGQGIAQYTSDPVFRSLLAEPPEKNPQAAALLFTQIYSEPALTWERLKTLRQVTRLPILVKGIQHPDDAALALEHGFDGLIVSNHGGRQVDGAAGAFDLLPRCADRVKGRIPVLFDSGIRTGADVVKALASGADAVCLGRPYVHGLALAGEAGVAQVLADVIAETDLTLALSGQTSVSGLTPDLLEPADG